MEKEASGYTAHESEDEVILRMGTEFRVKSDPLDQSNGSYVVHLIETDDNNDQPLALNNSNTTVNIPANATWAQNGTAVARGNVGDNATNQLNWPQGFFVDEDQTVVVADTGNHGIIQWKNDDTANGQVVAGATGQGNENQPIE
ncbi:unnamed protein product [Rotaria socialis]|uniref:Uncharacterized protein n=1 Tax=Rotaria socialis TaxID=392032 RepID=A0A818H9G8_9BILA|nr:unnamed protein product [Rotaria socialis]CAF4542257.1 unnamed protein product [Rotaria socialis]